MGKVRGALFVVCLSIVAGSIATQANAADGPPPLSGATETSAVLVDPPVDDPGAGPITSGLGESANPQTRFEEYDVPFPFNGGYVQHRPHVFVVFWGKGWNEGGEAGVTRENILKMYRWLSGSTYARILTQYFDFNGPISGETELTSYTDTRPFPDKIDPAAVRDEVHYSIEHQQGWQNVSYENQYVVITAPGAPVHFADGLGGTEVCALHGWDGAPWQLSYSYVQWTPPRCLRDLPPRFAMQASASHEWAESATDPIPLAGYFGWMWSSDEGEVADICNTRLPSEHAEAAPGIWVAKLADDYIYRASGNPCVVQDATPVRYEVSTGAPVLGLHSVNLSGTVNPAGRWAAYQFEFSGPEGTRLLPASFMPMAAGSYGPVGVGASVDGLKGSTTYRVRLKSYGQLTTATMNEEFGRVSVFGGGETQFTTPSWRPTIVSIGAANRTLTGATLEASIQPEGTPTTYRFEYGPTSAYGTSVPVPDASIGSGAAAVPVGQAIGGLQPETTYHYRLVATNDEGTTVGADRTFTTLAYTPSHLGSFGSAGTAAGQFNRPLSLAADGEGNVWVTDKFNNRLQEFNAKGEFLRQIGGSGSGNGQFNDPRAVAVSPVTGNLWIADAGNHRIQELTPSGQFVQKIGPSYKVSPEMSVLRPNWAPSGIAVTANGRVWVADQDGDKLEAFREAPDGNGVQYVGSWSGLTNPANMSTTAAGDRVYFTDAAQNKVYSIASDGSGGLSSFGAAGSGEGQLNEPYAVAVKPSGNVLVSDRGNNRVEQFSPSGEFLASFGSPGSGAGQFSAPSGVALSARGLIFVADAANNRVQRWGQRAAPDAVTQTASGVKSTAATLRGLVNPSGLASTYRFEYGTTTAYGTAVPAGGGSLAAGFETTAASQPLTGLQPETTYHYRLVATNGDGTTFGKDATFTTIPAPVYLSSFGTAGSGPGQMLRPTGVAVDPAGNVWVVDRENNRVQKYNAKGEFLMQFGSAGSGNGQFNDPRGIAITAAGNLWVAEYGNKRLQEFNSSGQFIRKIVDARLVEPYGVATAPGEAIWVSDLGANQVFEYREDGTYLRKLKGKAGNGEVECLCVDLTAPVGVVTDPAGNVWVADNELDRVEKFNATGSYQGQFGTTGSGPGQLRAPVGVTRTPGGNLIVVDGINNRLEEFRPDGSFVQQFGTAGSGPGQLSEPRLAAFAPDGSLYVSDPGNRRVQRWGFE